MTLVTLVIRFQSITTGRYMKRNFIVTEFTKIDL